MGASCTVCNSGGESYNLSHNRIEQEPHIDRQNSDGTAVFYDSRHQTSKTNLNIQDESEFSSSKDVNLQVDDETKAPDPEQEETETKDIKETQSPDQISPVKVSETNMDSHSSSESSDASKQIVKAGHSKTSASDSCELTRITEDEANDIINKCWKDIEDTCDVDTKRDHEDTDDVSGWRVVRLFVSSTFTDYHAERELLVKKVFPELREWCEERHVHLIECDLRWGVPKDTSTEMTIKTCLGEIDRCKEECNGVPFFLNMLGERYGWMPSQSDIPQDIQAQYKWIFPVSITHMEILHAAYRTKNPNAAIFIRDPGFILDLPPEIKPAFVDEITLNKTSLKMLKNKLKERLPDQVFEYRCEYNGIDQSMGKEKVRLKGLDGFSQNVLNHFKTCIEKTFPASQKELSPDEQELLAQDNFIRSKGSLLLGRQNEVSSIIEYANCGKLPGQANAGDGSSFPILLVQGVPGSGKSSLMAYCTLQVKKMDLLVFYHFVGSGPGSTDALKLSNRLYKWLKNITNSAEGENTDEDIPLREMQDKMQNILKEMEKLDKTVVVIIDAVNQLSDDDSIGHLQWLPIEIPSNVRFVVSAVTKSRSSHVLLNEEKRFAPLCLLVGELDDSVKKEIVDHILGIYNKKLDEHQMVLLINIEGATNPLWLSLSCEELRVFGVFERVTEHIQSLPSFLEGLLKFILKRLVTEDEFNNVEKVLCALYCMTLTETELRYLLKDEDSNEPLPMLKWAVVRRTLRPFLRNIGQRGQEERLDFFHASINDLVKESIMADANTKKKWHLKIADYFQYVCIKDEERATEAVALQLKCAGDKTRLLEFLRKDIRAQRKNPVWKSQYYKFILCGRMIPQVPNFKEEVSVCNMCSMQHKGFGQIAGLNKDMCCVCGNFVPPFWKKPNNVAMLCQEHRPRHAPGQKMCYLCNRPAFMGAETVYMYTCMVCSAGFQKCVKMVV